MLKFATYLWMLTISKSLLIPSSDARCEVIVPMLLVELSFSCLGYGQAQTGSCMANRGSLSPFAGDRVIVLCRQSHRFRLPENSSSSLSFLHSRREEQRSK